MNKGLEDAKNAVVSSVEKVKDAASEAMHNATADGEKAKRESAGDNMPLGDKVKSAANEVTNRAQADVDATKRDLH